MLVDLPRPYLPLEGLLVGPEQGFMSFLGAYEGWCNYSLPGTSDPLTHSDPLLANLNLRYTNRAKLKGRWWAAVQGGTIFKEQ